MHVYNVYIQYTTCVCMYVYNILYVYVCIQYTRGYTWQCEITEPNK
jgi:hypothetical protein